MRSGQGQCHRTDGEAATHEELVLLLYQGAIKLLRRAIEALKKGQYEVASASLIPTGEILAELRASLSRGSELSDDLAQLYEYAHWRLVQADREKDPAQAEEVLGLLRALLPSWEEAVRISRQSGRVAVFAGARVTA